MHIKVQPKRRSRRATTNFTLPAAALDAIAYSLGSLNKTALVSGAPNMPRWKMTMPAASASVAGTPSPAVELTAPDSSQFNGFAGLVRDLTSDRRRAIEAIRAGLPAYLIQECSNLATLNIVHCRVRGNSSRKAVW